MLHLAQYKTALSIFTQRSTSKVVLFSVALIFVAVSVSPAAAQYIYVANAGEDTVSKININTNQEVARYATWFTLGSPITYHT